MSIIDWAIIVVYALVMLGIGIAANRRQSSTDEYFRGARQLPWWAIGISLIATSFSAGALLGGPGQGYNNGFLYLQLQLGDLLAFGLVMVVFLPFFVQLNLTTAYEYLEQRFDIKTRSLGSLFFILFVVARLGTILYGASLVVATVTGLNLYASILLVGIVSILYTVAGGMAAVVWTDVLQFFMIFVGLAAGIWATASKVTGGLGQLLQVASANGKLTTFNLAWQPDNTLSLPTVVLGYSVVALAVAGTNQQSVQRYVACADVQSGRKAIFLGWFSGFVGVAATLLIGVLLFGFYQLTESTLPADVLDNPDKILPYFIVNEVPAGAAGLLITAIFAAAMSSIDSALHSLSTCMTVDFFQRFSKSKRTDAQSLRVAQALIIFWGIMGILSAFYVASTGQDLLPLLVTYVPMFLGPILGMFLMGIFIPRINATGAFYGTVISVFILVLDADFNWLNFPHPWWRTVAAVPAAIGLGYLISCLGKVPPPRSLRGLTIWH